MAGIGVGGDLVGVIPLGRGVANEDDVAAVPQRGHEVLRRQVEVIDIGGGLPVNFDGEEVTPTFSDYAALLRERVPVLFSGDYRVRTEFGRAIFAKNGFIESRIEYTKQSGGRHIATGHAGGQVATRTVFMPEDWKIRISGYDATGRSKAGPAVPQDVAGPLCFAGDLAGRAVEIPLLEPGDHVVLHDTGAYYFSNPFYYNALSAPPIHGVRLEQERTEFSGIHRLAAPWLYRIDPRRR